MRWKNGIVLLLLIAAALAAAAPAFADDLKDRMLARLPQIEALKDQGVVGEDKNGFLQLRGAAGADAEALVNAENADRAAVYQAIAAKQGVSPEVVGQRRALQIAQRAKPGEWLQKPDGSWYRK